jgi:tetratricopeptide (TPR) repeat protein
MKSSKASQESSKASQVMRWVGYGTAILSLVAGIGAIGKTVLDRLETRRKIDALIASESVQLKGHDYESAWRSLEQASQADPGSARVHAAQEALAMEWLENIHAGENESFSGIVEKLEPVLTRGVGSTQSQSQQADLLAHVGWSYFLRSREGNFGLDPASAYAEAVKRDANNPYAQAMWGHWILWNRGPLADAEQHFSSALASNRQRAYVRQLQLAALMNGGEPCEGEIIRVANAIRKEQGVPDLETQHRVFSIYYFKLLHPDAATTRFINAVPPAEHVATFRWLFDGYALDKSNSRLRSFYLSALEEAAGQHDEALAGYRLVQRETVGQNGSLSDAVASGIQRLSRGDK